MRAETLIMAGPVLTISNLSLWGPMKTLGAVRNHLLRESIYCSASLPHFFSY
jgi:hypothetical protein